MTPPFTCHGSGSEYQPSTGCGSGAALVSGLRLEKGMPIQLMLSIRGNGGA